MEFSVDMATLEKLNQILVEKVDPKYKGLVDPTGIDKLKGEIAKNPELKKFFKVEQVDKEN